jgi:hypothetical protein
MHMGHGQHLLLSLLVWVAMAMAMGLWYLGK